MFSTLSAWFSVSCEDNVRNLWEQHGGVLSDADSASFLFSEDAASPDTLVLHESEAYAQHELVVLKPEWIGHVINAGSRHLVNPGPFILSPREYEPLIGQLIGKECNRRTIVAANAVAVRDEGASSGMSRVEESMRYRSVESTEERNTQTLVEALASSDNTTSPHSHRDTLRCHPETNVQSDDCGMCEQSDTEDNPIPDQSARSTATVAIAFDRTDRSTAADMDRVGYSDGNAAGSKRRLDRTSTSSSRVLQAKSPENRERVSVGKHIRTLARQHLDTNRQRHKDMDDVGSEVTTKERSGRNDATSTLDMEKRRYRAQGLRQQQRNAISEQDTEIMRSRSMLLVSSNREDGNVINLPGIEHIDSLMLPTQMKLMDFVPSREGCCVKLK